MRPGGGKSKGSGFEGLVAKKLGAALDPLKFIRTQNSGARVGGKNFETLGKMFGEAALKLFVGDVVPVNEIEAGVTFKHSIETKFYKTPDNFPALVSGNANVFGWMQEAMDDAVKVSKNPLLIFKWNNSSIFVASTTQSSHGSNLILTNSRMKIFVSYFDDLLKYPDFWVDGVLKSSSIEGNSNEQQNSQETPSISSGNEGTEFGT